MEAFLDSLKEHTRIKDEIEYLEDILNCSIDHDCDEDCDCYDLPLKIRELAEDLKRG